MSKVSSLGRDFNKHEPERECERVGVILARMSLPALDEALRRELFKLAKPAA